MMILTNIIEDGLNNKRPIRLKAPAARFSVGILRNNAVGQGTTIKQHSKITILSQLQK